MTLPPQLDAPPSTEEPVWEEPPPSAPGHVFAARVTGWLPALALTLMLAFPLLLVRRPLRDPDTWWHLRVGEDLWRTWQFSSPVPWTQFERSPTWGLTQWMPELLASRLDAWFGLPGVSWLATAGIVGVISAIHMACRRAADPLPSVVATVVALLCVWPTLTPRPQLLSFILLAVFTSAWLGTLSDGKPRWWLVPLTYLWACSHGMWFTGPLTGCAAIIGLALDGRTTVRRAGKLALVPIGGVLFAAVTPAGPRLLLAPWAVAHVGEFVTEWQPPDFRSVAPAATMAMIALVTAIWLHRGRPSWGHVAILGLGLGWTLLSVRTVTLGAILAAPLLAEALQSLVPADRVPTSKQERRNVLLAVIGCLLAAAVLARGAPGAPGATPNSLDRALDQMPAGTVVFNEYQLGGWLQWRHRQVRPVIDGRTENYEPRYISAYLDAMAVSARWQDFVSRTGSRYALLRAGSPLATGLVERLQWSSDGEDAGYVLLQAPLVGNSR